MRGYMLTVIFSMLSVILWVMVGWIQDLRQRVEALERDLKRGVGVCRRTQSATQRSKVPKSSSALKSGA